MGRKYSAILDAISVTNDSSQDIFEIVNSANAALTLHSFELYSALTTDERVNLKLVRRSTTGSAGGTAITPKPLDGGNTVASKITSFTPLVTTQGTVGDLLLGFQWSQLAPLIYLPTPELQIEIPPSGRLCLALGTAVAATRTWSGHVIWEEFG